MAQAAILWLVVLVALVILFAMVARRMSVLVGRTRDLEQFQQQVGGIDSRLDAVVGPLVTRLDEIRRRSGDPQGLADGLPVAQEALRGTRRGGPRGQGAGSARRPGVGIRRRA